MMRVLSLRRLSIGLIAAALLILSAAPSRADSAVRPGAVRIRTLAVFDHARGETPENQATDGRRLFVSLAFASTVVTLNAAGHELGRAVLDTRGGFIAGLVIDPPRRALAVAVSSPDPTVSGIWEFPLSTPTPGIADRLAALPAGAFPNGLTVDPAGNLYAADSLLATIWRITAGYHGQPDPAQAWAADPLLGPDPAAPGLPGANGLKYRDGYLYVSNTGRSTLLRVPVAGPRAGTVGRWRTGLRVDDFTFGSDGTLYAALNQANQVVQISTDQHVTVLADGGDGIHNPSSVAIVRRGPGLPVLDVTNAAFDGPQPPPSLLQLPLPADQSSDQVPQETDSGVNTGRLLPPGDHR